MLVLHLTRDFPPRSTGGISTAVGGLVEALGAAGQPCAVLSFDAWRPYSGGRPPARQAPGAELRLFELLRVGDQAELPAALARCQLLAPDLIHVHHDLLWEHGAALARRLAVPAVLSVHVLQHLQDELRGLHQPTRSTVAQERACREAAALHVPSAFAAAALTERWPALAERLWTCPWGIAAPCADGAPEPPAGLRLVSAGRFSDLKGTALLFDTVPLLLAALPRLQLDVAGGVPENERAARGWARRWQLALESTVPDGLRREDQSSGRGGGRPAPPGRARLHPWLAPPALRGLLRGAALFLTTTRLETFGLAAAEAMACGVPVLAPALAAMPELIAHERDGLLLLPERCTPAGLVEALQAALADPERLARLGAAAQATVRRRFAWPALAADFKAWYQRLRRGGAPGGFARPSALR